MADGAALTWPAVEPAWGRVRLRAFTDGDLAMVRELATDPYIPLIGSLPADASVEQALAFIARQRDRLAQGAGFSFCVAGLDDQPLGSAGLWVRELAEGGATAGYTIRPSARGHGLATDALLALTSFAWTLPGLRQVELYIEPGNLASRRTAEQAGYHLEATLARHQEIGGRLRDMCRYATSRVVSDG